MSSKSHEVVNLAWCLPRPRRENRIPGAVPAYFEGKLFRLLELASPNSRILQPFGGFGEYGLRLDIRSEVSPDFVGDAHNLPFADDVFDAVFLDPPYDYDESKRMYNTGTIKVRQVSREAVRVTKPGGLVIWYHMVSIPVPPHTVLTHRILVETRSFHAARIVHVQRKDAFEFHTRGKDLGFEGCSYCGEKYAKAT